MDLHSFLDAFGGYPSICQQKIMSNRGARDMCCWRWRHTPGQGKLEPVPQTWGDIVEMPYHLDKFHTWGFPHMGQAPKWLIIAEKPKWKMDDDWRYPDSGNLHIIKHQSRGSSSHENDKYFKATGGYELFINESINQSINQSINESINISIYNYK